MYKSIWTFDTMGTVYILIAHELFLSTPKKKKAKKRNNIVSKHAKKGHSFTHKTTKRSLERAWV